MFGFGEFVLWLGEGLFSDVVEHGEFVAADDCVAAGVVVLPFLSVGYGLCEFLGGLSFGLYHLWQLYGFPTVFLLGVALGYIVWWKKDIRLSISLHVFANALMRVFLLMSILAI